MSLLAAALLLAGSSTNADADSVCGPGKRLVDNAWACAPYTKAQRQAGTTHQPNRIAAGIALGGALLSIVEALASQSRLTDDASSINPILQQHANLSVEYNRRGLALQQAGRYNEARLAFRKAAEEAIHGGSVGDSVINDRNADIADALNWLRQGYDAERAGQKNKANIAYTNGLQIARSAKLAELEARLERANEKLVSSAQNKGLIKSNSICQTVNGKLACLE